MGQRACYVAVTVAVVVLVVGAVAAGLVVWLFVFAPDDELSGSSFFFSSSSGAPSPAPSFVSSSAGGSTEFSPLSSSSSSAEAFCSWPAPSSGTVIHASDFGAVGDGVTDDTAALQDAIDAVAGTGGTLEVAAGTYMVDASKALSITGSMMLKLADGCVLQAIPNALTYYRIIHINGASDVVVHGGVVKGERNEHSGTVGEWGFGVLVSNSNRVYVVGVTSRDCWGDGFYVGDGAAANIYFCNVVADNNRRQGLSITSVSGMEVSHSSFTNTKGTAPEAGIDLEPNAGETVKDVLIHDSYFGFNNGSGTHQWSDVSTNAFIINITHKNNHYEGNRYYGLCLSNTAGPHRVLSNKIGNSNKHGLLLSGADNVLVQDNTVVNNEIWGLANWGSNNTLINNTVAGNGIDWP